MPFVDGISLETLPSKAAQKRSHFERLTLQLKQERAHIVDDVVRELDTATFERIDCLDCANCCKTTPALIQQKDMDRIAAHLQITVAEFLESYVEMDEDGDFVTKGQPCPFLLDDNACSIYDVRPSACADYPHTASGNVVKNRSVLIENTSVCPAVFRIVEQLEKEYNLLFPKSRA